jgi:Trypsin
LIAPDIILTAGHVDPPRKQRVEVRVDHAKFHSTNFAKERDDDETFSIVAMKRHPKYYTVSWDAAVNDYNIFKISGFSRQKPVKLNRDPKIPHSGDRVTIIGMGSTDPNPKNYMKSAATHLQEVDLTIISQHECEKAHDPARPKVAYRGRIDKKNMVCTTGGHRNHKDACAFDSGSPVLLTPSNSNQQEDLVVALVSWGEDCADPYFPAVHARVDYAMDWISQTVCSLSDAHPSELEQFHCHKHRGFWKELHRHYKSSFMAHLFRLQSSSSSSSSSSRTSTSKKSIFAISFKDCFWAVVGIVFGVALVAELVVAHERRRRRQVGVVVEVSEQVPLLQSADAVAVQSSYDTL